MTRRQPVPSAVYGIVDQQALDGGSLEDAVEAMAQAGISWIQIRAKPLSDRELLDVIDNCCRRVAGGGIELWVNDRADIASLCPVSGLHLGQRDCPPAAARLVVGGRLWIGASNHDTSQLVASEADQEVDVVAVGPVFPTRSKEKPDPVVGLDLVRRAKSLVNKPLVAIGGIDAENAPSVLEAGACSIAVIGALCRGGSIERNARRLLDAIR